MVIGKKNTAGLKDIEFNRGLLQGWSSWALHNHICENRLTEKYACRAVIYWERYIYSGSECMKKQYINVN